MKEWIETLYDFTKWVNEIIKNQMSKEIVFGNSESQQATVLTNTFQFIPRQQSYSANFPQKPQISGSQTAIVVGPEGEEIFTDNQGNGYNSLMFDDATHQELFHMHAERDMETLVKHDQRNHIKNASLQAVKNDYANFAIRCRDENACARGSR